VPKAGSRPPLRRPIQCLRFSCLSCLTIKYERASCEEALFSGSGLNCASDEFIAGLGGVNHYAVANLDGSFLDGVAVFRISRFGVKGHFPALAVRRRDRNRRLADLLHDAHDVLKS